MSTVMSAKTNIVTRWMMKGCCDRMGQPNFEKMKNFMERCGKHTFSDEEISTMNQFCAHEDKTDVEKIMAFMERCGCFPQHAPESGTK